MISDLCHIPTRPDKLITVSANKAVQLWDVNATTCIYGIEHTAGVRTVAVWDQNPGNLFFILKIIISKI